MPRCPKGTQRNKTTGECEPKGVTEKQPRCPKGTQRNKTTGNCEPKGTTGTQRKKPTVPSGLLGHLGPLVPSGLLGPPGPSGPKPKCPKGTQRNKTTGECESKGPVLPSGKNLENANLKNANLKGKSLKGKNLKNANLEGANLQGANLKDANLEGANLKGANLKGANLESANLKDADLKDANLEGAVLTIANLTRANLSIANLRRANLRGANLIGANLTSANLIRADLAANLTDANLTDATLTGTNLGSANLTNANLTNAILRNVILTNTKLIGAILIGTDLKYAKISFSNLTDANLTNAILSNTTLSRVNLTDANLTGANLTNAQFDHVILTRAGLTDANLTGANLTNVHLLYAYFLRTILTNTKFTNVDFRLSFLLHLDLTSVEFISDVIFGHATLTNSNLSNVVLVNVNFRGAHLSNSNFTNANLTESDFTGANLTNANLTGANLTDATLTDAILTNTNLTGANLTGVDLPVPQPVGEQRNFGIAYEIHEMFKYDFDFDKFMTVIREYNTKQIDNKSSKSSGKISPYVDEASPYLEGTETDKQITQRLLKPLIDYPGYTKNKKILRQLNIAYSERDEDAVDDTIQFVLLQSPNFIRAYIDAFTLDCANAYKNGRRTSCIKGQYERVFTNVKETIQIRCLDTNNKLKETCKEVYTELYSCFLPNNVEAVMIEWWDSETDLDNYPNDGSEAEKLKFIKKKEGEFKKHFIDLYSAKFEGAINIFNKKHFTIDAFEKLLEKEKTPTPIEPQVNIKYEENIYNFKITPDATLLSELKDMILDKLVEEGKITNKNYTVTFNFSGKMYNTNNEETANKLISAIIGTNYYAVMRLILKGA